MLLQVLHKTLMQMKPSGPQPLHSQDKWVSQTTQHMLTHTHKKDLKRQFFSILLLQHMNGSSAPGLQTTLLSEQQTLSGPQTAIFLPPSLSDGNVYSCPISATVHSCLLSQGLGGTACQTHTCTHTHTHSLH